MNFENALMPEVEQKNKQENIPNKTEEISVNDPENEPTISPAEFNTELAEFRQIKADSLAKVNQARAELGIPESNELPVEASEAEKRLESSYGKLDKGDYVDLKELENNENVSDVTLKNKESSPEINTEKGENNPLMPGDEIFSEGNFYKVYDIHNLSAAEEQKAWDNGKDDRDREWKEIAGRLPFQDGSDRTFKERQLFDDKKRAELKERGPVITAIIKGGEEVIELDSRNVIKIETPDQREKIVKMQKEEEAAGQRAANFMGMGPLKKMVDKATGQPGKF